MNKVRHYFRVKGKLGKIDVSDVKNFNEAIVTVKELLWQGGANRGATVFAVAK
jgi:hypothetical protein